MISYRKLSITMMKWGEIVMHDIAYISEFVNMQRISFAFQLNLHFAPI